MVGVQQAVGEKVEVVPGFTSISRHGVVHRCVAYYNPDAKRNGLPINAWATALWHTALKRDGFERGLRREDEAIADWLNGNVLLIPQKVLRPRKSWRQVYPDSFKAAAI
jgi:hypothetical protein